MPILLARPAISERTHSSRSWFVGCHAIPSDFTQRSADEHAVHADTDTDLDVDGSDLWNYSAYDERWRMVATYRSSDDDPKERFVHHQAGDSGYGGSSYIDLVAFREKDANTAWTTASDGVLEQRIYYCQNQHADVVSLITSAGGMREMDRYSAYGVPFGLPVGDANSDGKSNSADRTQIQNWIDASNHYDVRGDLDLDGDVDLVDKDTLQYTYGVVDLGRGILSANAVGNRRGVAGYFVDVSLEGSQLSTRRRHVSAQLGVWLARDPVELRNAENLLEYCRSQPIRNTDPMGLTAGSLPDCNGQDCKAYSVDCYIEFTRMSFTGCPWGWNQMFHDTLREVLCIYLAVGMESQLNGKKQRACPVRIDSSWGIPSEYCTCDGQATFVSHTDTNLPGEIELPIPSEDHPACKAKVSDLSLHLQIWSVDGHCRMVESGHVPGQ